METVSVIQYLLKIALQVYCILLYFHHNQNDTVKVPVHTHTQDEPSTLTD